MKKELILFLFILIGIMLMAVFSGLSFFMIKNTNAIKEFDSTMKDFVYLTERLEMFNKSIKEKVKYNGFYDHEGYYCVYTRDREDEVSSLDPYLSGIEETALHEYLHALILDDYEGFCEGGHRID